MNHSELVQQDFLDRYNRKLYAYDINGSPHINDCWLYFLCLRFVCRHGMRFWAAYCCCIPSHQLCFMHPCALFQAYYLHC